MLPGQVWPYVIIGCVCVKYQFLNVTFVFTDTLLMEITLSQLEKSVEDLNSVVKSLTVRIDQLETMEERLKNMEQHMQAVQHPTFQPLQYPPWE